MSKRTPDPFILEEGVQWQSIDISPRDAQFLESRRFQVAEGGGAEDGEHDEVDPEERDPQDYRGTDEDEAEGGGG